MKGIVEQVKHHLLLSPNRTAQVRLMGNGYNRLTQINRKGFGDFMSKFQALLSAQPVILGDGAMGTMLFAAGLEAGASPERWNVEHPEKVMAVHRAYAEAGSNLILTNTFGGSRFRLAAHGLAARVGELNRAAAENARKAVAGIAHPVLIGGSVGPTGEMLEPLGTLTFDEAVQGFAEQAAALRDGGVDYFQVETFGDLREIEAAIQGIRSVSDLPIVATMSFDTKRRTMMGTRPQEAASRLRELGVVAFGANCGSGTEDTIWVVEQMHNVAPGRGDRRQKQRRVTAFGAGRRRDL